MGPTYEPEAGRRNPCPKGFARRLALLRLASWHSGLNAATEEWYQLQAMPLVSPRPSLLYPRNSFNRGSAQDTASPGARDGAMTAEEGGQEEGRGAEGSGGMDAAQAGAYEAAVTCAARDCVCMGLGSATGSHCQILMLHRNAAITAVDLDFGASWMVAPHTGIRAAKGPSLHGAFSQMGIGNKEGGRLGNRVEIDPRTLGKSSESQQAFR